MTEAAFKLAIVRSDALFNYYQAERRAGADPVLANERMHFYAKRLDDTQTEFERDLQVIRDCMERTS